MKIIKIAAVLIITTFVVTLLIIGKPLLIPFFIAVVIWYLINAMNISEILFPELSKVVPLMELLKPLRFL